MFGSITKSKTVLEGVVIAFSISYAYEIIDRYSGKLAKIRRETDKYRKASKKAGQATKNFGKNMLNAQSTVGSFVGVIGGAALVGGFVRFEETMNVARGTTRSTAEQFEQLRNKAKDLGATTEFSASQAASGIEMLGRNGLKATQIMNGAIDATLLLASATGADLSTSANIATDVMANFNKKASDLGVIVDRISGVTITSKFNINDYALALGQAGGVAGELGVSLAGFNTTISATAPLFKSGAGAGTSFKTFLQRLVPTSKEAAKLMKQLGLITKKGGNAFFDSSGKMKSMAEISGALNKSLGGLSDKQKASAVSTIFGNDAMRTALGLSKMTANEFKKLSGEIDKVSAKKLAEDRLRGLGGALKIVRSTMEAVNIAVFDSGLADFLTVVVEKVSKFLAGLSETHPWILRIIGGLGLLAVVIGPVLMMVGMMALGISAVTTAMTALAPVAAVIAGIFGLISLPVLLVVGAVALLIAGFILIRKNWATVVDVVGGTIAEMVLMVENGIARVTGMISKVKGFFGGGSVDMNIASENSKATAGSINGSIQVSAGKGASVDSAEMSTSFPGNLGLNMAPAGG